MDGVVVGLRPSGRPYDVETSGGTFPKNRRFLRLADGHYPDDDCDVVPDVTGGNVVLPRRSSRLAARRHVRFAPGSGIYSAKSCFILWPF